MLAASRPFVAAAVAAVLTVAIASGEARQGPPACDPVIRGGTVFDGRGAAGVRADIAVSGASIGRVGDLGGARGAVEIDAAGLRGARVHQRPQVHTAANLASLTARGGLGPGAPQVSIRVVVDGTTAHVHAGDATFTFEAR